MFKRTKNQNNFERGVQINSKDSGPNKNLIFLKVYRWPLPNVRILKER
jgi:hypothetical protein